MRLVAVVAQCSWTLIKERNIEATKALARHLLLPTFRALPLPYVGTYGCKRPSLVENVLVQLHELLNRAPRANSKSFEKAVSDVFVKNTHVTDRAFNFPPRKCCICIRFLQLNAAGSTYLSIP